MFEFVSQLRSILYRLVLNYNEGLNILTNQSINQIFFVFFNSKFFEILKVLKILL